jgi:hypothetical protein
VLLLLCVEFLVIPAAAVADDADEEVQVVDEGEKV